MLRAAPNPVLVRVLRRVWLAPPLCASALTLVGACTRDAPPSSPPPALTVSAPAPAASVERTSAHTPSRAEPPCEQDFPPADLIAGNMASTDLTGLGEIVAVSVTGTDGKTPAPSKGYVHFKYTVRVLRQFSGGSRDGELQLTQGAEASAKPRDAGTLLFFSACEDKSGRAHEPDVGYFFPIDAACRKRVEALADAAVGQPQDAGASACER